MTEFILALLQKKNKLKLTTLYQILIGKKTSSVLSYAFFMDLLPYLGSFPQLSEAEFQQTIKNLLHDSSIEVKDGMLMITKEQITPSFLDEQEYRAINYFRFGRKDETAWRVIQFFIQQLTTKHPNETIALETTPYYTEILRKLKLDDTEKIKQRVYEELQELFSKLPSQQSDLLVATLSGGMIAGETFYQVFPEIETIKGQLYRASAWHNLYHELLQHNDYVLYRVIKQPFLENLNQSVLMTRMAFLEQQSIETIAQKRRLKESTIRDHLIEWAILDEQFPFALFPMKVIDEQVFSEDIWAVSYKEFQTVLDFKDIDFLVYRLYQIKRKRESVARKRLRE